MPRRKRTILAVERIQPNTLISESGRYIKNFIALEEDTMSGFKTQSLRKVWNDKTSPAVVEGIMKDRIKPKKGTQFFYDDEIAVMEIKLSDKVKPKDDYIYRLRNLEDCSVMDDIYVTYKELLASLGRKIKNKYACVMYDGNRENIEYSENEMGNLIARMTSDTNPIMISQINKGKCKDNWYEITIYKNMLPEKK